MDLFKPTGAHVLVDGQFGSTGKGAFASFLATEAIISGAIDNFAGAVTSAGPNSGHTSYFGHAKRILKQLPTFGVHCYEMGSIIPVFLSAGAVINPDQLRFEANQYPNLPIFVHENAAIVTENDIKYEMTGTIRDIASTQTGTGSALARKIIRDPKAIAKNGMPDMPKNVKLYNHRLNTESSAYFMEVSQGFSLGINSQFYPHVTSRECTVMQAIADARIPPRHVAMTYMCVRTYPIRVGNLGNHSSGGWYDDQEETTWDFVGVKPEITTVTHRERRVATFSFDQLREAMAANDPDWVALSFLDYLSKEQQEVFLKDVEQLQAINGKPFFFIGGYGPHATQWKKL